jgi:hypothetical protein
MPRELLPSIFELFVQGENSLDRSLGGLGIGFIVVRSIVELHYGSIAASSEGPGRGSSFTVSLPLAKTVGSAKEKAPRGKAASATSGLRVLVVDDNVDGAETLCSILDMWAMKPGWHTRRWMPLSICLICPVCLPPQAATSAEGAGHSSRRSRLYWRRYFPISRANTGAY